MKPYYEHAGITIYHGDCREILPQLGRFDLLLTDPPYGIGASRRSGFGNGVTGTYKTGFLKGKTRIGTREYAESDWDDAPPDDLDVDLMRSLAKHQIIFGGNYFKLPPSRCWLVWDKINGDADFADCELAWTNLDKAVRKFSYLWNGMMKERPELRTHPTQKPLSLMKWCLSQAPQGVRSVVDPYMGSGTTLVACKAAGLAAVGCEREEAYCETAAKRLSQEVFDFSGRDV